MKTIGLIGGMSWESSLVYYRLLNEKTKAYLGGFESSKCILYSVNFAEIEQLQHENNWSELDRIMAEAAKNLYDAGADIIILGTNTMHLCSEAIISAAPIPFLHIAEAAGQEIQNNNLKKVGLLGTKFTMEKDFYKNVLHEQFNIDAIIPSATDRLEIHRIIYEELVLGHINERSKNTYIEVMNKLIDQGAEGIILGCTEIPLLVDQEDVNVPVFDTTAIHAEVAVKWAIN